MALLAPGNDDTRARCNAFIDGFERAFVVFDNGTLKCDRDCRTAAEQYFNNNKFMIMLITAVDVDDLAFENPGRHRDDQPKQGQNAYVLFLSFHRLCQVLPDGAAGDRQGLPPVKKNCRN